MTTVERSGFDASSRLPVVDIAGTAWPIYKLEAIAAGLIVFLIALVVVQSLQIAVLGAATVATALWTIGLVRQTSGSSS